MTRGLPARPLSLPDIIAGAFQLYVRQPVTYLLLALPKAAFVLALTLGNVAVFDALGINDKASSDANVDTGTLLVTAFAIGSFAVLSIASDAFGDAFIVPAALTAIQGKAGGVRVALACWRGLAGAALLASLLIGLRVAVTALTVLLVPVAIFLYVRWSLAIPALFAERTGGAGALRRSAELVSGSWWRVFGITVAIGALTLAPQALLQRAFAGGDTLLSAVV
ncbi:MAG TPA: hypothetical protein VFD32_19680, partial [Dehalococcoidia bacterium]|nr:hypothetical protein [Dehalococcoidia bacterium]